MRNPALLALASSLAAACAPAWQPPAIPPAAAASAPPGPPAAEDAPARAVRAVEAEIPMRDGVKLHTQILIPEGFSGPMPILLRRTPYQAPPGDAFLADPGLQKADWVRGGMVFVVQDIRGRFRSEGQFVMNRPPRDLADPKAVDETTDAYDTIDWLVKNVPNSSGKVGMVGTSYDGWLVIMALLEPHPALAAAVPQAAPADLFLGDDFLHNGALRRQPALEFVALMEAGAGKELTPLQYDRADTFEWHLELPLSAVEGKALPGVRPTWRRIGIMGTWRPQPRPRRAP